MARARSGEAFAPTAVTVVLLAVYVMTLAPSVTYWDAGEFLAAIRTLGIPHPPGTPLYIIAGNVWARALGPLVGFARAVNVLSAISTAFACGIATLLMQRWTGYPMEAAAGGILAGLMSSVWLNANETEVYAPSLLVAMLLVLVAERARVAFERRWLVLLAYLCGLGWSLQLSALVAAPAAFYLALFSASPPEDPGGQTATRRIKSPTTLLSMAAVAIVGASAVLFMLVRAKHDPAINQGNPASWQAFLDVLSRKQYQPAPILPRQSPWFLQLGNLFEYADWQIALGMAPEAPPSWLRSPFTIAYAVLGAVGCMWHRRIHQPSWRALMLLFFTATVGVVAYLNMKAGPSYGQGFLPPGAKHEARERDYFFSLAFVCWGIWAGAGAVRAASRMRAGAGVAGLGVAFLPMILNWSAVDRSAPPRALIPRDGAMAELVQAPRNAVIFAIGDNDTYPAWYVQQVERVRPDVVIVTIPLLGAQWYREELERRYELLPASYVRVWRGKGATLAAIC
ncbi:MAG TPA: DUF2723 domain-containing protein, partial [Gemmatimonadaceae bacterium]|nr:DUF2723 domain-containing protein [Gemmatimonadaceae bacterium]